MGCQDEIVRESQETTGERNDDPKSDARQQTSQWVPTDVPLHDVCSDEQAPHTRNLSDAVVSPPSGQKVQRHAHSSEQHTRTHIHDTANVPRLPL